VKGFVYSAVAAEIVLLALYYRQLLICVDLIEQGRVQAPRPDLFLFNRATKQFLDFVIKGKYRSSSDATVLRSYGRLRATLLAQMLLFVTVFICVLLM
jgi:hypothetical protein